MEKNIKIAIAGIGNCASALIQGIFYYKDVKSDDELVPGLMHNLIGGYKIGDIKIVAAFDIDKRKVGRIYLRQCLLSQIVPRSSVRIYHI